MEFDEKSSEVNCLSFHMLLSEIQLSFSVIEIIELIHKLLSVKNTKKTVPLFLSNQKIFGIEKLEFYWKIIGMCITYS